MFKKLLSQVAVLALFLLSLLPLPILYCLADLTYILIYRIIGYRKNVVRENLHNSFPEKGLTEIVSIEKTYYKFLASLIFEIIKMKTISRSELTKRITFKNTDLVEAYLKNNESVLFCSSHYGNYEWVCMAIGLAFSGEHYPIYKPLTGTVFDKWFFNMRSRFGNKMVAMRQTVRAVQASKNTASMFTFGSDQAPSKEESLYWTSLLNQEASIQLGIEKIARKTDRPVFYLKINYVKRGYYEVDCVPICLNPKETAEYEITEMHTNFLEDMIKEQPAYWLWSHRRWKYQPVKKKIAVEAEQAFFKHKDFLVS